MARSLCARTRRITVADGTTVRILHADSKVFVGGNTRAQVFDRRGRCIVSLLPALFDAQLSRSQPRGISMDEKGGLLMCSDEGTGMLQLYRRKRCAPELGIGLGVQGTRD